MMKNTVRLLIYLTFMTITGCGGLGKSEETAKISAVEQQFKNEEIGIAEMLVRKRDIYRSHSGLDRYQEAYYSEVIIYARQLETGAITVDQFTSLEASAKQKMELMQKVNCMKVRQENQGSDHSGIDSTSGLVAIVSLGGLIAETVNEARACR